MWPRSRPHPGDTAAAASGRLPGRDDLVCGEARGVAWLSGRLEAKRQALPLSSPPNRHGPRVVLAPNERPALISRQRRTSFAGLAKKPRACSVLAGCARGRAIRLSDGSGCRSPMPAGTRSSAPAITEAACAPCAAIPQLVVQPYLTPVIRAAIAASQGRWPRSGFRPCPPAPRSRCCCHGPAWGIHGALCSPFLDPVPHRVRSPVSRLKIMHGLHARDLVESRGSRGLA